MAKTPDGFVPLGSLKRNAGAIDRREVLAEIRRIYFATTERTIQHDFAHALELLKSLPADEDREKAAVYMEGLNEMRREWDAQQRRKTRKPARPSGRRR